MQTFMQVFRDDGGDIHIDNFIGDCGAVYKEVYRDIYRDVYRDIYKANYKTS